MRNISERENTSLAEPASSWTRWGGRALVLAGGLWIITYLAGAMDRRLIDPDYFDGSTLMWIGMIASEVAQICLGISLIVLGARLWTRAKVLASGRIVLETIALVAMRYYLSTFHGWQLIQMATTCVFLKEERTTSMS